MKESAIETLKALATVSKAHEEYSREKTMGVAHAVSSKPIDGQKNNFHPDQERVSEPEKMKGLGDLVAKTIEKTTGIKSKEGCGCKKRQAALNKWVPVHKNKKKK